VKKSMILIVLLMVTIIAAEAMAISLSSSRALDAFRRYEPDFANSLRRLEELDRKIENQNIQTETDKYIQINDEAEYIMDYVQKRYDLM
jgi:hypothetical protein